MDLSRLSQGEKIVLIAGGLLLIDLLFLPWYDFDRVGFSRSAVESPKAFWGVLAALVAAAMVAAVVVTRFTTAPVPALPVPLGQAMFVGGVTVAGLLLLKLLLDTDFLGVGAWLGIFLGGAVAYGGFVMRHESEGAPPPTPL